MAQQKEELKAKIAEEEAQKLDDLASNFNTPAGEDDETKSGRSRNTRRQVQSTSSRTLRKKTPLKPMPLEMIEEENSMMGSGIDVMSQRDATNPFEAMRALRRAETSVKKPDVAPAVLIPEGTTMDESSQNRWYRYYKKIGYSHEQLYDMGLA